MISVLPLVSIYMGDTVAWRPCYVCRFVVRSPHDIYCLFAQMRAVRLKMVSLRRLPLHLHLGLVRSWDVCHCFICQAYALSRAVHRVLTRSVDSVVLVPSDVSLGRDLSRRDPL